MLGLLDLASNTGSINIGKGRTEARESGIEGRSQEKRKSDKKKRKKEERRRVLKGGGREEGKTEGRK